MLKGRRREVNPKKKNRVGIFGRRIETRGLYIGPAFQAHPVLIKRSRARWRPLFARKSVRVPSSRRRARRRVARERKAARRSVRVLGKNPEPKRHGQSWTEAVSSEKRIDLDDRQGEEERRKTDHADGRRSSSTSRRVNPANRCLILCVH